MLPGLYQCFGRLVIKWVLIFPLFFFLQKSLKKEHFLWQLFNIEKDITKASKDLEAEKRSREEVMRELEHFEDQKRGKRKELAKYLKEIAQCEKKIAERNNRLDKSVSFSGFGIVVDFIWFILLICAGICRFWLVLIKFRYLFTHSLEMDAICDGFSSVFGKSGFTEKVWDYRMHLWTQRLIALQLSSGEQIVHHYNVRYITVSPILFSLAMGRGWNICGTYSTPFDSRGYA